MSDLCVFAVSPVVEEEEAQVADENNELVSIPINMADPNPNGEEFDCLYLDMNGIVCTPALRSNSWKTHHGRDRFTHVRILKEKRHLKQRKT